jgi:glycosyltransferase involved in cell wall biosynthesis
MLTDIYFPMVGGISTAIRTLRHALTALGHQSVLLAPNQPDAPKEAGVIRHTLPVRLMEGQLREEQFDLVHVFTPTNALQDGVRLGDRFGLPVMASCLSQYEEEAVRASPLPSAWARARARRFARARYQQVRSIVVPSAGLHRWLRACGVTRPIHELRVGLDAGEFLASDRASVRIRFRIPPDRPILLYVGRLVPWKRVDFLLRVVQRVQPLAPSLLFIIAGEGPEVDSLKKLVDMLGIKDNVLFQGNLLRDSELSSCFAAADILLQASRAESQGLAILEALAHGLPVLTTENDGTREISLQARGVMIAPPTEAEFAVVLAALLRDLPLRRRLSDAGREYAIEWHAERMAEKLLNVYGGLTLGRR